MSPASLACTVLLFVPTFSTPVTDELVRQLQAPEPRTRRLAAEALGKQKAEDAIRPLAGLLADPDAGVRTAAGGALVRVGPKAVPALGDVLRGENETARIAALTALARLGRGAKEAVGPLTTALAGKQVEVRIRAAEVLGQLGADARSALPALFEAAKDPANVGPVLRRDHFSGVTEAAVAAALQIDPGCTADLAKAVLPDLTAALKSRDDAVLQAVGSALYRLGSHARPALPALEDAQARARGFAELSIRRAIISAGGDVTKPLVRVIRDSSAPLEKRVQAVKGLHDGAAGVGPAVAVLGETLKDSHPRMRAAAAEALGTLGEDARATVPALVGLFGDAELEKAAAKDGLSGDLPLIPGVLARIGKDSVPGLAGVLGDEKQPPLARYYAVLALGKLGVRARAAKAALERALADPILVIALESAGAYARVGGDPKKALPVVRQGLGHKSPVVVGAAVRAVERMGLRGADAVVDLAPLLEHADREVRIAAAHAVCRMGPDAKAAVPAMADLLVAGDGRTRFQVAQALGVLGPDAKAAVAGLVESLKDDGVRTIAPHPVVTTLGAIGPGAAAAVPALVALLEENKRNPDQEVMIALGKIGPGARAAVPHLIRRLEDRNEHNRAAAARGLGGIGPGSKEAVLALTRALGDESKKVRVWAAFALARIVGDVGPRVRYLIELWEDDVGESVVSSVRFDLAEAFDVLGREARPARDILLDAVTNEKTPLGTRLNAARALGNLRDDAGVIVPKLVELIGRPGTAFVREGNCRVAAETLGRFGPKARAAAPHLRKLLDDDVDEVVDEAARALERITARD